MTIGEYYVYKNKYVDIPILNITSIPNYVPNSESFRIYFSYDSSDSYGFPDRPAGASANEITSGLYKAPPSLKAEWFPAKGDKVILSNNAYFERYTNTGTTAANWSTPIVAGLVRLQLFQPNGTQVSTSNNSPYMFINMSSYNDDSGSVNYPPESEGVWVYARMQYENFQTWLTQLAGNSVNMEYLFEYGGVPFKKVLFGSVNQYLYTRIANQTIPYSTSERSKIYNFYNGVNHTNKTIITGFQSDPSKPRGGDGEYEDVGKSDDIPIYNPSSVQGVASTGGVKTHQLTNISLPKFHDFMFSDAFNNTWDSIRKSFGSPQECIVGFRAIYAPITVGTSSEITLGNIATGVTAPEVNQDYVQFDCGSITVPEVWGNFLDYDPFTSISLYLPYCSTVQLPANEVVGGTLSVKYNVDLLTGACAAEIYSTKTDHLGTSSGVIMRVNGNCAIQIPWSMVDATNQWRAIMGAVTTVGLGVSTGIAGLASASAATKAVSATVATATPVASQLPTQMPQALQSPVQVNDVISNTSSLAQTSTEIGHLNVVRGGNSSANVGALQHPKPYLTITRPIQSFAENYGHYYGFPSNITAKLSSLNGFTKVAHVNLESIPATSTELELIRSALQSGIII